MIVTERLVLRPLTEADRDRLIYLLKNEVIKKTYMIPDFHSTEEEVRMASVLSGYSHAENRYLRGIYLDDLLIGFVNDVGIEDRQIELGYVIDPVYHNQGYASEMLAAVITELRKRGFTTIKTGAFTENTASRRVMEKCGMKLNGEEEDITYRGELHRCIYYSV